MGYLYSSYRYYKRNYYNKIKPMYLITDEINKFLETHNTKSDIRC